MEGHLEKLRRVEVEAARPWFKPGLRVLEIGAGSGFQSSLISSWGCHVAAIDIANHARPANQYYPVGEYDGRHIPFNSGEFDVVFSSNVLEHIRCLPELFGEIRRVMKPGALAVHVLPTPAWRLWTSLAHYVWVIKYVLTGGRLEPMGSGNAFSLANKVQRQGILWLLRRALFPGPHGEYASAFAELWYFSRTRWLKVFGSNGFVVEAARPVGLFYTGYSLFPGLSLEVRKNLSTILGSACRIFVMHKNGGASFR